MPHKDPEVRKAYLREYHRKWYAENKTERQEQIRDYKQRHKSDVRAYEAEYRSRPDVRVRLATQKRLWRALNSEREKLTRRRWYRRNRNRWRAYSRRAYWASSSERARRAEYNKRYYLANRERLRNRDDERYRRNRDAVSEAQYKTLEHNATAVPTPG